MGSPQSVTWPYGLGWGGRDLKNVLGKYCVLSAVQMCVVFTDKRLVPRKAK